MVALLKYEFKSTSRTFLPLYGTMLILSFFIGLSNSWATGYSFFSAPDFVSGIPFLVFFALSIAIMVLTLVITVERFSDNLLGDEGYLMFTLPVSSGGLILSKLIVATSWFILSGLCLGVSILAIAGGWYSAWNSISDALKLLNPMFIENAALYIFEFALSIIVQAATSVLMIYAAISIGHLSNRNRGLMGFFAFIALLIIQGLISGLIQNIFLDNSPSLVPYTAYENISIFMGIGLNAAYAAVCFFITDNILKTRLNLE